MSEDRRRDGSPNASSTSAGASSGSQSRSESQIVPVRVAGHEYKIRSSGDPEQLQQIARDVDRAMKRVGERTGTVDTLDLAVLTCLNLGREILALRERGEQKGSENSNTPGVTSGIDALQLRNLIERVEAVVAVDGARSNAADAPTNPKNAENAEGTKVPRTLELPSVEALRDRNASASASSAAPSHEHEEEGLEQSRVAAGGRRDRAS